MRLVFLNTSILTSYGRFSYRQTNLAQVCNIVANALEAGAITLSAIGHESTAKIMSDLLGVTIHFNRIEYRQQEDDLCIVFKMNSRIPEGKVLSAEEIEAIGYTWGLLTMEGEDV